MANRDNGSLFTFTEKGSALTSAMMIVGILTMVGIGIATLLSNMSTSSSLNDATRELDGLTKEIQLVIYNDLQCPFALRDATANPKSVAFIGASVAVDGIYSTDLITGTATRIIKSGTPYKSGRLQITGIDISQVLGSTPNNNDLVLGVSYRSFLVNLMISATTKGRLLTKSMQLKIYTNPAAANKIQRCSSVVSDNQSCTELGGYFDSANGKCIMPVCDAAHVDVACISPCTPQTYSWAFVSQNTSGTQKPVCVCNQNCQVTSGYCPPAPITVNTINTYQTRVYVAAVKAHWTLNPKTKKLGPPLVKAVPAHWVYSNVSNPLSTITVKCSADGNHVAYKIQPTGKINTGYTVSPSSASYGASTKPTFAAVGGNYFADYTLGTPAKNANFFAQFAYGVPWGYYYFGTVGYDGGHQMRFWNVGNPSGSTTMGFTGPIDINW